MDRHSSFTLGFILAHASGGNEFLVRSLIVNWSIKMFYKPTPPRNSSYAWAAMQHHTCIFCVKNELIVLRMYTAMYMHTPFPV